MPKWKLTLRYEQILSVVFFLSTIFLLMPWIHGNDGAGYYAPARSLVVDGDLNLENEFQFFRQDRELAAIRPDPNTGKYYAQYPIGVSLIWLPAVYLAHGISLALGQPATGYTSLYYWLVCFWSAFLAFFALLRLFRFLTQHFARDIAFWAIFSGWLATNLFYYMFFEASLSHAVSFFLMTLFFLQCYRLRYGEDSDRKMAWIKTGLLAGLIFITRLQDGIVWLIPAVIALEAYLRMIRSGDFSRLGHYLSAHLLMVVAIAVAVAPDLFVNILQHDKIWVSGPGYYHGSFREDQWWYALKVLFSPHHGLIFWTPMVGLGIIGLGLLPRPGQRILLLSVLFLQLLVTGFWNFWHGAQSFSHRFFVGYVPLFIYGLAQLQYSVGKKWQTPLRGLFVILILLNFALMAQYGLRMIPSEGPLDLREFVANFKEVPKIVEGVIDFIRSKVVPQ